jgi:hypothetical protein
MKTEANLYRWPKWAPKGKQLRSKYKPQPGIYYGVPASLYHSWPYLNATTIKAACKSMLQAKHAIDGQCEETPSMATGTILHNAVLEGGKDLRVYPGKVKRGKEWEEFKEANVNGIIIGEREQRAAMDAVAVAHNHRSAGVMLEDSVCEVSIVWDDLKHRRCKARLDGVGDGYIYDYKTTRNIEAGAFMRQAYQMQWHVQLAHYLDGWRTLTKQRDWAVYVIAQESKAPYDCRVIRFRSDIMTGALMRRDQVADEIDKCKESGVWPGLDDGVSDFELPAWAEENTIQPNWDDDDV